VGAWDAVVDKGAAGAVGAGAVVLARAAGVFAGVVFAEAVFSAAGADFLAAGAFFAGAAFLAGLFRAEAAFFAGAAFSPGAALSGAAGPSAGAGVSAVVGVSAAAGLSGGAVFSGAAARRGRAEARTRGGPASASRVLRAERDPRALVPDCLRSSSCMPLSCPESAAARRSLRRHRAPAAGRHLEVGRAGNCRVGVRLRRIRTTAPEEPSHAYPAGNPTARP
jgi:hypothetical protein